jgi:hypothetical protein
MSQIYATKRELNSPKKKMDVFSWARTELLLRQSECPLKLSLLAHSRTSPDNQQVVERCKTVLFRTRSAHLLHTEFDAASHDNYESAKVLVDVWQQESGNTYEQENEDGDFSW